jgi:CRP-like cAMP-binding protein
MSINENLAPNAADTAAPSLQYARPRLKAGQIFSSLVSTSQDGSLLFELADGSRQVSLPTQASQILPLLDGTRTIPDVLEALHQTNGRVPFKTFFSTVQKLQIQGCLDGAELLATANAKARTEMFEREQLWLTRPIFSLNLVPGKVMSDPSALAFGLFALGTLIVTLSFLIGSVGLGYVKVPSGFLRIQDSYVKGLLFFFAAASVLVTAKTVIKTILSLLLTGARSRLNLELGLFSFAVRSSDDKIYMAGGRAIGTLAFAAVASSYFFIFAVASAVAPHWSRLDDLFWVSLILALVDLNPFRKSDLSSFFNIVYNQRSAVELLPYLQNRGIISLKKSTGRIVDTGVYTAYSAIAMLWTMVGYNVLLALISRNDALLLTTMMNTLREGPFAEFLAAFILAASLGLSLLYLIIDLVRTLAKNVLFPLRSTRFLKKAKKQTTKATVENVENVAHTIAKIPLFSGLHPDAVMFLLSKGEARNIPKGTHVVVQGTSSTELYLLISGSVAVVKRHDSGDAEELTRLSAPTVFGENTLLAHKQRSADVIAVENSTVIAIPRRAIDELMTHSVLKSEAETLLDRLILGQYVASSELFKDAPSEVVSLFFNEGQIINVATGRHIIEQGRTDKDFYLLIRGSVDVIHDGQIVARLQQGDFFGEMALILNSPRTATIITREPCRLLKLTAVQFWGVLSQHASIALYLETVSETRIGEIAS